MNPEPEPLLLSAGYGFRRPTGDELRARGSILDTLAIWEHPRRRGPRRYVLGVDVADGLGGDASCIQVVRVGTIDEPEEQVAEYASDQVEPSALAYIIQAIGQYYTDEDRIEALVAIERTHHGLSTIDTLHLHLGYTRQYLWEYFDAADPSTRYANTFGWNTTPRTRPVLVDKLRSALLTVDAVMGLPDLITHSPALHEELRDFQTSGALWEAAAARGAHDDRVMALGIAHIVAWRMQAGEAEPLEDRRRRRSEQQAVLTAASPDHVKPDWRNTPTSAEEADHMAVGKLVGPEETDLDEMLYDPRSHDDVADYRW